jgi:hypothetical protein
VETKAGAEQDEEYLIRRRTQIHRRRHEFILRRVEPGNRFEALRIVAAHTQRVTSGQSLPARVGCEESGRDTGNLCRSGRDRPVSADNIDGGRSGGCAGRDLIIDLRRRNESGARRSTPALSLTLTKDSRALIDYDGIEYGIARDLLAAGIPAEDILFKMYPTPKPLTDMLAA